MTYNKLLAQVAHLGEETAAAMSAESALKEAERLITSLEDVMKMEALISLWDEELQIRMIWGGTPQREAAEEYLEAVRHLHATLI